MLRSALIASILLAATPAFAIDLSVDLTKPILTADGKAKIECLETDPNNAKKCTSTRPLTFGVLAAEVLSVSDQALRGDERAKAGFLAIKIAGAGPKMTLTLAEATLIKQQADKFLDPVSDARMRQILEPQGTESK